MSQIVLRLLQRLATPAVASALAKEELCLALAAAAQLKPFDTAADSTATTSSSSSSSIAAGPLARRSLRVIPQCSAQELRMVAQGATALRWPATAASSHFVADALVQTLHRHITHRTTAAGKQRGSRVRLPDVLAVAAHAMDAQNFFDATVSVLLTRFVETLACELTALSRATAAELVAVVCAYLGVKEGLAVVQRVYASLVASPGAVASSPGMAVLKESVSAAAAVAAAGHTLPLHGAWATAYRRWSQDRRELLESISSTSSSLTDVEDATVFSRQKAKHDVLRIVQRLLEEEEEEKASGVSGEIKEAPPVSGDELLEALEAVKVFHIYDPITTAALDEALRRRAVTMTPPSLQLAFESVVFAQAQRFPRTLALLRACDAADSSSKSNATGTAASAEALQHISAVQRCYQTALAGGTVTEKELYTVGEEITTCAADDVARALFVFAYARDVPPDLTMLLASSTASLTLQGVAALLLATRHDRAGALRTLVSACLSDAVHQERCVAASCAEDLIEVASVLTQPHTKWTSTPSETLTQEAQLLEAVLSQLHVHVETLPWVPLLSIVRVLGRLPAAQQTVCVACQHLTTQLQSMGGGTTPVIVRCEEVIAALQGGDVVDERLLDVIVSALTAHFASLSTAAIDDARHADLLRLVLLELAYEMPELAEALSDVVQVVSRAVEWTALPVELLVAAALLSLDGGHVTASSATALALPHRVLHHLACAHRLSERMTAATATAVVELVSRLGVIDSEATLYVVKAALPLAVALPPTIAARLVCAAHEVMARDERYMVTVPPEAYAHITGHLRALPADVFTALCAACAGTSFDAALANRLVEMLPPVADKLTPAQLARCVFGLGEMPGAGRRLSHQVLTEALSDYVVDNVELFTRATDIAALLHGFAKLQCTKRNLYSVFAKVLNRRGVQSTLDFQSISFLLFAFGSVKFVDQRLMNMFCERFVDHVNDLTAPDLLMALRGVSRMCLLNAPFYAALGDAVCRKADEFPLQAQCELLHAYGSIEQRHSRLTTALVPRIAANVAALPSASAVVDVLMSLWMMDLQVSVNESVWVLTSHVVRHAGDLTCEDLVKLSLILRETHWTHRPLLHAMTQRSLELKRQERLEGTVARAVLDTLAHCFVFHAEARTELSPLARSVSKEVTQLSGDEQEQLNLLLGR